LGKRADLRLDFWGNAVYYQAMLGKRFQFKRSYSLLELAIGLGATALLLVVGITIFKATVRDNKFSKAEDDLQTLKNAVMTYWKDNSLSFPSDVHRSLASTQTSKLTETLKDPWATNAEHSTYGFVKSSDPNIGEYFIVYTQGPNKDTRPHLNAALQVIEYSGSGLVVSNLPTKKIN
jgi:type II secretory pathway pseudopilin PulG